MAEEHTRDTQDTGEQLFTLASQIIGLAQLVIVLLFVIVIGLLLFYAYLIMQPTELMGGAASQLSELIRSLWSEVTPYVSAFLRLIAPVFILLFALGVLYRLSQTGASPFDVSKLFSDLPSLLALIIIITICLLPLAGLAVPEVLSNVALVVVGFYFGKRTVSEGGG